MAGDKNKHTIWALLLSLLALTTIFQQNYHNNQLVATPDEMVGLYCRDQPLNDLPLFLCVFTQYQDLPSEGNLHGTRIFLLVSQEDPSSRKKYNPLHVNRIKKTYGARMISRLHVQCMITNTIPRACRAKSQLVFTKALFQLR